MTDSPTGTIGLNNYLQSLGRLHALSWVDTPSGPQHAPTWTCECKIDGITIATGTGSLKHTARDEAADQTVQVLRQTQT